MTNSLDNITNSRRGNVAMIGLVLLILVYIGRIQELVPHLDKISLGKVVFILSIILLLLSPRDRTVKISQILQVKYAIGILLCGLISVPLSHWPGGSLDFIFQVHLKTLLFFYLVVVVANSFFDINKIIWAIALSAGALSISVLISGQEGRLSASSTYDPNDLAFVLVTFMPLIYYFMTRKSGVFKIVLQCLLILMLVATLATASRGGIVGFVVISAIIMKKQGTNLKQILSLLVIVAVITFAASDTFWERMSTMLHPGNDYNITAGGGRIEIWKNGLKMMFRRPFTGVGIDTFEVAEGAGHVDPLTGHSGKWNSAHNSFIEVGAELGIIGLYFFVKLILVSLQSIKDYRRKNTASDNTWFLDGLEVSMYGYITTGFFLSQGYSSILYLLVALTVLLHKLDHQRDETVKLPSEA